MVSCPICNQPVNEAEINDHIDSGCETHILSSTSSPSPAHGLAFEKEGNGAADADDGSDDAEEDKDGGGEGRNDSSEKMVSGNGSSTFSSSSPIGGGGKQGSVHNFFRPPTSSLATNNTTTVTPSLNVAASSVRGKGTMAEVETKGEAPAAPVADLESTEVVEREEMNLRNGEREGQLIDTAEADSEGRRAMQENSQVQEHHKILAGQKRSADLMAQSERLELGDNHTSNGFHEVKTSGDFQTKSPMTLRAENGLQQQPPAKRPKPSSALARAQPLAERMRPQSLDGVLGQDLIGPDGVLRTLILSDKIPSMILWGGAGTGKTTIARLMASQTGARFVEINSTSTGVGELKKIFTDARAELGGVQGRKTVIFCDEIHRFSRSQQDVFLGPVEAGIVTLVGATTENPSFKVQAALLSRCRVFTLKKLEVGDVVRILQRAIQQEGHAYAVNESLVDEEMINYLAAFADGDARTGLNLLELAMDLSSRRGASKDGIKASLTKTLVYDRAGDQHYDTISAFHKSVRGSDPHAALYYLARMIQSGEDALYIARRMVVIASEDIGLADNNMLTLATSTYAAAEKIGMPEARINLAHCAVALALSRKSTRAYRGLGNATVALKKPGLAGLAIPIHLRNAPTRLLKELGYGKEYKYNPNYVDGRVKQDYLPEELQGMTFLEERDLGSEVDEDFDGEGG